MSNPHHCQGTHDPLLGAVEEEPHVGTLFRVLDRFLLKTRHYPTTDCRRSSVDKATTTHQVAKVVAGVRQNIDADRVCQELLIKERKNKDCLTLVVRQCV